MKYILPFISILFFGCGTRTEHFTIGERIACTEEESDKLSAWILECMNSPGDNDADACTRSGRLVICRKRPAIEVRSGYNLRRITPCIDVAHPSEVNACAPYMKEAAELPNPPEPPPKEDEEEERTEECSGPKIEVSTQFEPLFWFGRYYFKGLWGYCL